MNAKGRIVAFSMLILGVFFLFAWKFGLFCCASGANSIRAIAPLVFANIHFRIDFTASKPEQKYRLDIAPGSAFVPLPGSTATVSVVDSVSGNILNGKFRPESSNVEREGTSLTFAVPAQEGLYGILFTYPGLPTIKLLCLVPFETPQSSRGIVDDVRIGAYPDPDKGIERVNENPDHYIPPRYFIRTDKYSDYRLAPTIKVGDLVCPTSKDDPTKHVNFAVLDYTLLLKVEYGWRVFSREHPEIPQWKFVSWFRTPIHNKREGGSSYSRHIYGDACDIIVDLDGDWRMDDINRDGRIDMKDALEIARVFEDLEISGKIPWGGIGTYEYPGDESMGAAVHIDTRGHWARWGYSWMSGRKKNIIWYAEEPK